MTKRGTMKRHSRVKSAVAAFLAIAALLPNLYINNPVTDQAGLQLTNPFKSEKVMAYSSSTAYYNKAFKGTAHVTSHINVNHIEDSRLVYQNWNNIYGLASSAWQMSWPQPYSTHRGQDWDTLAPNEPLYAVHAGTVTRASYDSTYGNRVEVSFGNWMISMAHMNQIDVKLGSSVQAGQKLGNVGRTGNVTGEHVHISLYYQGKLVDPHPFLTGVWDFDTKAAELENSNNFLPGIYTNSYGLGIRVRSGAGTNFASVGTIAPGSTVNITGIVVSNGIVWGKHSMGYSAIKEGSTAYMAANHQIGSYRNVAALNLMVRSSASTSSGIVGSVAPGSSVNITGFTVVGNVVWGKHAGGWSCLGMGSATYLRRN